MHPNITIPLATFFCIQARCQAEILLVERAPTIESPPACSLNCLATLTPQFCGSLTNTTCICTDTQLMVAVEPCALAACNVTDNLQLQRYTAESCGILNDKTRQNQQLYLYYVLPTLATIFVLTRLYVRIRLDIGPGADDWVMLAALCIYLTSVGTGLGIVLQGFGQHTFWLSTHKISKALMFFYLSELTYLPAITLTKLSLLLFFRRIFPQRRLRIGVWIMFGFVILSNLPLVVVISLQCIPFHGNWTNWMYKVPPIRCIDTSATVYIAAGLSILHDIIILLMPIPILLSLNLSWQKKLNVLAMFSVGSFVILCSVLRLPTLKKLNASTDPSYDQAPIAIWTNLEVGVGLVCGCLPAFRSLIGHIFPSLKMSLVSSNRGSTRAHGNKSRLKNKQDRGGASKLLPTFIELEDHQGSQDNLNQTEQEESQTQWHGFQAALSQVVRSKRWPASIS